MEVAMGRGEETYCFVGIEFQFCRMKRALEIGCTAMWMYLILLNCTLKVVNMVKERKQRRKLTRIPSNRWVKRQWGVRT
jgi:hypothetical protein